MFVVLATQSKVFCYSSLSWIGHPDHKRSISLLHSQPIRMFRKRQKVLLKWEVKLPKRWQCTRLHGSEIRVLEKEGRSGVGGKSEWKNIHMAHTFVKGLPSKTLPSHYISPSVKSNWIWGKLVSWDIDWKERLRFLQSSYEEFVGKNWKDFSHWNY